MRRDRREEHSPRLLEMKRPATEAEVLLGSRVKVIREQFRTAFYGPHSTKTAPMNRVPFEVGQQLREYLAQFATEETE